MPALLVADDGAIVGRDAEIARLLNIWEAAREGSTRLVLVAGEPGVGKSRLVAELARIVHSGGGTVLVGCCDRHGGAPYAPFVEALGPALDEASDAWLEAHVERHGRGLTRLFPTLNRRVPEPAYDEKQPGSRSQMVGGLTDAITGLHDAPLLVVLEDLHWATRSTVLVLEHLAAHTGAAPVLVVGTYRDDAIAPNHPLTQLLDFDAPGRRIERVVLANLAAPAVTELLADRAEMMGESAAAAAVDLWRSTEGHPLVLTEGIRELLQTSALGDVLLSPDDLAQAGIPHDVASLVARRMGRCRSATREVVEAASIAGFSFSAREVNALTELKEDRLRPALEGAVEAGLIVEGGPCGQTGHYRFIHALVQEAVYRSIPANKKVRLHHQLAAAMGLSAGDGPTSPATLVHHLSQASPVGQSLDGVLHAQRAGDRAMEVLAFEEAAGFYGQALAFLGGTDNRTLRVDLLMALGDANHRAEESARARQSYLQAAALAREAQDGPRLGRAVLGLGDVMGTWGTDELLIALLEQALDANGDDPPLRATLTARLAQARVVLLSPDERKAQSDEAWELAWESLEADTIGRVLRARHEALSAPDELEDRLEADGELVTIATAAGDDELVLQAHAWRSVDLLEEGKLTEADRDREAHAKLARRLGDPRHLADAARWAAMRALLDGQPKRATAAIQRSVTLANQARDPQAPSVYWMQQHALLLDWGDDAELAGLVEAWQSPVRGDDGNAVWRSSLALLLARVGRDQDAADELDDLLDDDCADLPPDRAWLATVGAIGEVAALLGDRRAPLVAELLARYSDRLLVVGAGVVCRGSVSRVLGLLSAATGQWSDAERHFEAALLTHERLGSAPLLARTRAEFGRAMAAHPGGPLHVGRNRSILIQAADEAERCGMVRVATEARAALGTLPQF